MSSTKFKKGKSGNPNGRPKGSKNKRTDQWLDLYDYMLSDGFEKFKIELAKLEGKEYVDVITKLMKLFKPKSLDLNEDKKIEVIISHAEYGKC